MPFDISLARVRARVARGAGPGTEATPGEAEFTQQAKKALELSLDESRAPGHHSASSFHVLLALLREEGGLRARTLSLLETDPARLGRAAERVGCNRRIAEMRTARLAEFMRVQFEKQAAITAGDLERVHTLEIRSRGALMPKGPEKDRVVARIRALLAHS